MAEIQDRAEVKLLKTELNPAIVAEIQSRTGETFNANDIEEIGPHEDSSAWKITFVQKVR